MEQIHLSDQVRESLLGLMPELSRGQKRAYAISIVLICAVGGITLVLCFL